MCHIYIYSYGRYILSSILSKKKTGKSLIGISIREDINHIEERKIDEKYASLIYC